MIKLTKDQPNITRDDLTHWCVRILQMNENFVNLFYHRTQFDPRVQICKEEFCQVFVRNKDVMDIQFFKVIPEIIDEFKDDHLNIKGSLYSKGISLT